MVHRKIVINGTVQDVSFRIQTKRKAEQLGITGLIRNKPDGSVMIEAHGDERAMRVFLIWCKRGPIGATIDRVVASSLSSEHTPNSFTIIP
ncbi:MAG: acylphosphatase [bacterium]